MQNPVTTDFFSVFSDLSQEQRILQNSARQFVTQEVMPQIRENYEQGKFPLGLAKKMGSLGFLGAQLKGYGCAGLGPLSYGLVMKELERGDSGVRSFASVQSSLVMYPIFAFGSDEQKEKWLPLLARAEAIGCFGLTEPDGGSNPAGMRTVAKLKGNQWVLNGSKTWITNAHIADVAVIFAKTEEGIRGFLVEQDRPGFVTQDIKGKLSMRASSTGSIFLDDCLIPKENMLPKTDDLKQALMCLTEARYGIAWGAVGAAEDCLLEATSYAKNRVVFDKPIASCQLVQRKLAIMATEIAKANLVAFQLAKLKDKGQLHPAQVSMAKQNNVQIAIDCARTARDVLGANGISDEYHCMRHACNLESVYTYEGTNDIHLLIVGNNITGLDAFQ